MTRACFACLVAATLLAVTQSRPAAEDPVVRSAPVKKADEVLAGHSYHGEAFNEGARQKAYLMGGTGHVTFPATTRSPLAQRFINQGIGQLHGFWYFEAERSFRQAASIDPDCALAYWGMAFANKNNSKRAKGFIKKAIERKKNATDREVMYIDALNAYINTKGSGRSAKGRKLAEAFGRIYKKYPNDIEARAFQGLYLYFTRSRKPAMKYEDVDAVLRDVLKVEPRHPCHHYLIHLWDYKNPAKVLPSAAVCGQASPSIAHMWHMPGHTYSRLKRYRDAAWQQEASARVDHAHMIRDQVLPDQIHNFAHNNEWLTRNLIYVGRMHDAVDLAKNMIELPRHPRYNTLTRRGSTYYGRLRLFQVLNEFELWGDLIALADTPYLEPTDREAEQIKRLRYLGRAYFATGDAKAGTAILTRLERRLKTATTGKANAARAAEGKFFRDRGPVAALKPGRKPRKGTRVSRLSRKLRRRLMTAKSRAGSNTRNLQSAVKELKGRKTMAAGDLKAGFVQVRSSGGLNPMGIARMQSRLGDHAAAEKTIRAYVKSRRSEVLPLAHLVEVLWKAGKRADAKKEFRRLRKLAGDADLDAPALARLTPIAAASNWPRDWRTPPPIAKDFGPRPELDTLGPFRWHPFKAADWTLKDVDGKPHSLDNYRGKPVVVIFYLGYGCLHCAEQLEAFAPKTEAFRKAGYSLIAISTDNMAELKKSQKNYDKGKFAFPLVTDAALKVFKTYRVFDDFENQALHGTFVIDGQGYVRWHDISYEPFMDPDFVLKEAQRLLKQSPASTVKRNATTAKTATGPRAGG
ncbi:MAG: redoxin domain-containing protein [Planctomycetaceae bacterium]